MTIQYKKIFLTVDPSKCLVSSYSMLGFVFSIGATDWMGGARYRQYRASFPNSRCNLGLALAFYVIIAVLDDV